MSRRWTLGDLRRQHLLTQKQLAEQAGLSRAGVQTLEEGVKRPTIWTMRLLARVLGPEVYTCRYGWRAPRPKEGLWRDGRNPRRLPYLRLRAGLTQHQLAALAGLSPATVGNIETGVVVPKRGTLGCLARVLGTRVHSLEFGWNKGKKSVMNKVPEKRERSD